MLEMVARPVKEEKETRHPMGKRVVNAKGPEALPWQPSKHKRPNLFFSKGLFVSTALMGFQGAHPSEWPIASRGDRALPVLSVREPRGDRDKRLLW